MTGWRQFLPGVVRLCCASLLRLGPSGLPEHIPAHVAGNVGHADPGPCSGDADGADEEAHVVFLVGEDMLDAGSWPGSRAVGALLRLRHRLPGRLAEVNL